MGTIGLATLASDAQSRERRLKMINAQLRANDVADVAVLAAFLAVPRENFVASSSASLAYLDCDAPSAGAGNRKLLAPRTLGRLIQAAEVKAGERALEIGGGAGYGAAVLAELGASVVELETDACAAAAEHALAGYPNVRITRGDLAKGSTKCGPFDVILLNGAFEALPQTLLDELASGGRLVGVDARRGAGRAVRIDKAGKSISERDLIDARAEVLPGFAREATFAF